MREWNREPSFSDPCIGPIAACECRRCLRLGTAVSCIFAIGVVACFVWGML